MSAICWTARRRWSDVCCAIPGGRVRSLDSLFLWLTGYGIAVTYDTIDMAFDEMVLLCEALRQSQSICTLPGSMQIFDLTRLEMTDNVGKMENAIRLDRASKGGMASASLCRFPAGPMEFSGDISELCLSGRNSSWIAQVIAFVAPTKPLPQIPP